MRSKAIPNDTVTPFHIQYLNRLSDFLFVLCRVLNRQQGVEDVLWQPGKNRTDLRCKNYHPLFPVPDSLRRKLSMYQQHGPEKNRGIRHVKRGPMVVADMEIQKIDHMAQGDTIP